MTVVHPDPAFPSLHGRPPGGWVNDPNGCSYVDGRWHVFFQHNPDSPTHGSIKWGHMSSADLVRWRAEPVALTNRPGELDAFGCWSGCVVDDDGVPTAVYSAVADAGHRSEVLLARSDRRMVTWAQDRKSVAGQPNDPAIGHVRDPYVFTVDGHRYAVQGAGHVDGRGRILVYGCDDLTSWTFLGDLLASDDPLAARFAPANIWECPNLLRFGDRWVLIVSLWHGDNGTHRLAGVRYLVGDLAVGPRGPRFTPTGGGLLDDGPCFYAPQALALADRTLLWGWSWELDRSAEEVERAGWAGSLTFCRELALDGEVLVSRPAPELDGLRGQPLDLTPGEPFAAAAYDCLLPPAAGRVTLALVDDGRAETVVVRRALAADPRTPPRLLVDGSMVELFDGGPTAYTTRAYPTASSRWVLRLDDPGPVPAWHLA